LVSAVLKGMANRHRTSPVNEAAAKTILYINVREYGVGISEKIRYPKLTAMTIAAGTRIASVGLTSTFQGQSGNEYSLPKRVSL